MTRDGVPQKTNWLLIALLFCVGLAAAAQFAKIALTLDTLSARFPEAPVPALVSALSIAGIAFGVTAGVIVARFGERRVLLVSLSLAALASGLQATLPPFWLFLGLRVLEGGAHLAMVIAAPTLMSAVAAPKDQSVAMGIWGMFFGVGFAASAAVVPILGDVSTVYLAHAGALAGLTAVLWPLLPKRSRDGGAARTGFVAQHLAVYRSPRMIAPGLGFLWHTALFLGLLTFLPHFLGAWTAPVLPLIALVGTFLAGYLSRVIPPPRVAMLGLVISVCGLPVALLLPETLQTGLILALFLGIGLVPGASFATIPYLNASSEDRARANGALAQLGNVGTAASTPLMAGLLWVGLPGPVLATVVLSALGLINLAVIHKNLSKNA